MVTPDYVVSFRQNFPYFTKNPDSCYLDNAATTHICQPALDKINEYYSFQHATVHRSGHIAATENTNQFEAVRLQVAKWLNAEEKSNIVWTKGATEAANLVAHCLHHAFLQAGDEVIVSMTEHHASFVTWQQLALKYNFRLRIAPVDQHMKIDVDELKKLINKNTRVVVCCHVANATGVKQPIEKICQLVKAHANIISVVDGAQAINHIPVDVQSLGCDFYYFSAHKMYAGTGLGVLYTCSRVQEQLTPYQYGGEMVRSVSITRSEFNQAPFMFEAGTPNIASVYALSATLNFLDKQALTQLRTYEHELMQYLIAQLKQFPEIKIHGSEGFCGAVSFSLKDWHAYDVGEILAQMGVAVRTGKHCAMPLVDSINTNGTVRVSLAAYTLVEEIDKLINAVKQLREFL
ncbi:aminotransferase class V-fold PLP-dependent enzyme [Catenovulum sediminis]|uniref:Probable cysteine desulfurase n=1 Tax=Catenovulum sediminis TaxID=1740262 RepID=A0ABV1RLV8_9ALTE|nr:cysteine desulfurase [Catenovulum sediminis]